MSLTIEDAVAAVREVLEHKGVAVALTSDTPLAVLALDSLDLAEVLIILEEKARTDLDPRRSAPLRRVADLAALRPAAEEL
ncbi:MAG TPA: hypothetical protein VKM72_20725 [Thermoanaerobaculia bacterium]|nr:hypothetical protein [Thermoanaerobaculia bacterium]